MKLTFVYNLKLNKTQEEIVKEIMWHSSKIYNILNFNYYERMNFHIGCMEVQQLLKVQFSLFAQSELLVGIRDRTI